MVRSREAALERRRTMPPNPVVPGIEWYPARAGSRPRPAPLSRSASRCRLPTRGRPVVHPGPGAGPERTVNPGVRPLQ